MQFTCTGKIRKLYESEKTGMTTLTVMEAGVVTRDFACMPHLADGLRVGDEVVIVGDILRSDAFQAKDGGKGGNRVVIDVYEPTDIKKTRPVPSAGAVAGGK